MRLYLFALLAGGLLPSCVRSDIVHPGFRASSIPAMLFTPPVTAIDKVDDANQLISDAAATAESGRLLRQLLLARQSQLRLRQELQLPDSLRELFSRELRQAVQGVQHRQRLEGGANLPTLDYVLRGQTQRYVLLTVAQGFTRDSSSYHTQMIKTLQADLLPGSKVLPVRFRSDLHVFIYDGQRKQLVFYNRTPPTNENHPLNPATLSGQFRALLGKDFPGLSR